MTRRCAIRHSASTLLACAMFWTAAADAFATTLTFDGLTQGTGDPFGTYTEGGFTVTPFGGWNEAHAFGNPTPSIFVEDFVRPAGGNLLVTGGEFFFRSLDLNFSLAPGSYQITGTLGGLKQFDIVSGQADSPDFITVLSGSPLPIDLLRIDIGTGGPGSFNVDNIKVDPLKVAPVPEPGTWVFLAAGAGLIGLRKQRGKRRDAA